MIPNKPTEEELLKSILFEKPLRDPSIETAVNQIPYIDLATCKTPEDWNAADQLNITLPPDTPNFDYTDPEELDSVAEWLTARYHVPPPFVIMADGRYPDHFYLKKFEQDIYDKIPEEDAKARAIYQQWKAQGLADRPCYTLADAYHSDNAERSNPSQGPRSATRGAAE